MLKTLFLSTISLFWVVTAIAQSTNFMPMVYVKGGTFKMGSSAEDSTPDERPVHSVTLSDFWIGKYEVTVAQYRVYCKETGVAMPETPSWGCHDNHPIVNVSWNDANEFAIWLSEKTGRKYSLPTEAQWEYAARGGNRSQGKTYAGSNSLGLVGWFSDNSKMQTHPVGQKQPNELGIYDMSGNVFEWCSNYYDDYDSQARQNPKGANNGTLRVLRGGSWVGEARYCTVSQRAASPIVPYFSGAINGFRLVLQSQ